MRLYRIKQEYIDYLRTEEPKVLENKNERRPYIGIILFINNITYYVPLSSPKNKYKTMKNTKDFHKIAGGVYGAINFNKMIPVPPSCVIRFDFNNEKDTSYKMLLFNQYSGLSSLEDTIKEKSKNLYKLFHSNDQDLTFADKRVKDRCCNFTLLEEMCKKYK